MISLSYTLKYLFRQNAMCISVYLNDKPSNKKGLRQSNQLKGLILRCKSKEEGKCLRVCKYTHTR